MSHTSTMLPAILLGPVAAVMFPLRALVVVVCDGYANRPFIMPVGRSSRASSPSPLRFWLGMAQMFMAGTVFVLVMSTGLNVLSLATAALATSLTITSRWLFRRRS